MILGVDLGPHAVFIVASYAVTALVVAGLIAWIVSDYAAQRRILDERGVRRRSQPTGEETP